MSQVKGSKNYNMSIPRPIKTVPNSDRPVDSLTKRELFAMAAMQGMLSACLGISGHENDVTNLAQIAVKQADALLKELNK